MSKKLEKKESEPTPAASLVEQLTQQRAAERGALVQSYFDLLSHNDSPGPGDAARLGKVAMALGRDAGDLEEDAVVVKQLVEAGRIVALEGRRQSDHRAAVRKYQELEAWAGDARKQLENEIAGKLSPAARARNSTLGAVQEVPRQ